MKITKHNDPSPYIIIEDVLSKEIYNKLKFPKLKKRLNTRSGWDLFKGEKEWEEFFSKPYWNDLKNKLESKKFIETIIKQFETEIKLESRIKNPLKFQIIDYIENPAQQQRMYLRGTKKSPKENKYFLRFDLQASDGTTLRVPHVDHCRRIVGGVYFLCDPEKEGIEGGEFGLWRDNQFNNDRIPHDCEMVKKLPIRDNTMYVFLNSNSGFHGPNEMKKCMGMRKWIYFSISMKENVWPFEGEGYSLKERIKDFLKVLLYKIKNI